LEENDRGLS